MCVCDTMGCVCQADDLFVCFGAKPKQRPELEISDETGSGRKGRSERSERGSWQRNSEKVSWRRETQRGSRQRRAEQSGRLWVGCPENDSQQKSGGRLLRPDELHGGGLTNTRRCQHCWWLFVEVSRKIHASNSLQFHRECRKLQNYPSCTWSWHKSLLFVCSFFPTLSVVFLLWP